MPSSRRPDTRAPDVTSSTPVQVDSSASGAIIRWAFGLEAVANVIGAVAMLYYPSSVLALGVSNPVLDVNRTSTTLVQWLGGLVLGLTPQLLLGIPNTKSAIESRPMIYYTLLAGEGFLIPIITWQALNTGSAGLTPKALVVCAFTLVGPCAWRLWVLFVRPDWLGRYLDGMDRKAQ